MDAVRQSIHAFVERHTQSESPETDEVLAERMAKVRKDQGPEAKAARKAAKLVRKAHRGKEKMRSKKYRKSAKGQKAIKRRGMGLKKLGKAGTKPHKGFIRHFAPECALHDLPALVEALEQALNEAGFFRRLGKKIKKGIRKTADSVTRMYAAAPGYHSS
jgi:hypothetical protein